MSNIVYCIINVVAWALNSPTNFLPTDCRLPLMKKKPPAPAANQASQHINVACRVCVRVADNTPTHQISYHTHTHTHTLTQIDHCYGNPKGGGMHLCFAGFMMHFIQLGVGGMGGEEKIANLTWEYMSGVCAIQSLKVNWGDRQKANRTTQRKKCKTTCIFKCSNRAISYIKVLNLYLKLVYCTHKGCI